MTKQYADRDAMALDGAGGYYMRHVMAMTGEQLHSKGDIAAELGWRDMQIDALQKELDATANSAEWSNEQCIEFLTVAFRHAEISGDIEMDDIRLGVKMANQLRADAAKGGSDDK